jgi:hypothetical protein
MPLAGAWKQSGHKGGERFALLILSMYAEAGEPCGVKELIEETGMSLRQILRIIEDLKASGAVNAAGGKGRAPYIITLASANDDKMSPQETPSDDKKSQDKMASEAPRSDDKMASLADAVTLCQDNETCSDDILSGTEVAPSKALRTSTDKKLSLSAREAPAEPKRERETKFSREVREAYAAARGMKDGWMTLSRDGRYDEVIERWQQTEGSGIPAAQSSTAKPAQLKPDEVDSLIAKASAMLREGADISDVDAQFAPTCPRSQWATIRSAAQAQAKVKSVPAANHSPPAKSANVIPMARR